jgi:YgiT-type zinc finger domain-containing protein
MRHHYAECSFCGGRVAEKRVQVDYRLGDELMVFENVPAGVCMQCGERYYTAKVVKTLELISRDRTFPGKVIHVSVKSFPETAAI